MEYSTYCSFDVIFFKVLFEFLVKSLPGQFCTLGFFWQCLFMIDGTCYAALMANPSNTTFGHFWNHKSWSRENERHTDGEQWIRCQKRPHCTRRRTEGAWERGGAGKFLEPPAAKKVNKDLGPSSFRLTFNNFTKNFCLWQMLGLIYFWVLTSQFKGILGELKRNENARRQEVGKYLMQLPCPCLLVAG